MAGGLVLFCNCAYRDLVPWSARRQVREALAAAGRPWIAVADLCETAAARDVRLRDLAMARDLTIVACYPRAVKWLLKWAGVELIATAQILNMRTETVARILEGCGVEAVGPGDGGPPEADRRGDWVPWFPVIDEERCRRCRQCVSFCPFGVYAVREDGGIQVAHPRNCKDNCPACARMCPDVAIIFPKEKSASISGAAVSEEEVERRRASAVGEQLKRGDLHTLLAQRRKRQCVRRFARPGGPTEPERSEAT